MAPPETLTQANPVFLSRVRADRSRNSGIPLAQAIATNDPPQVRPVSSSRVRAERAHKSESAPFLGLFKMFKISTLRPLQFFAEHKFSQVAGEVFGARNRLNTRRTAPRPVRSKFKKFSRGTTPTVRGFRFLAPGVGATPWAPFAMRGQIAGALTFDSEDDSRRFPLFTHCSFSAQPPHADQSTTHETLVTRHTAAPFAATRRPLLAPSVRRYRLNVPSTLPTHSQATTWINCRLLPHAAPQRQEEHTFRRVPLLSHGAAFVCPRQGLFSKTSPCEQAPRPCVNVPSVPCAARGHYERIAYVFLPHGRLKHHEERSRPSRLRPSPSSNRSNTLNRYPFRPRHAGAPYAKRMRTLHKLPVTAEHTNTTNSHLREGQNSAFSSLISGSETPQQPMRYPKPPHSLRQKYINHLRGNQSPKSPNHPQTTATQKHCNTTNPQNSQLPHKFPTQRDSCSAPNTTMRFPLRSEAKFFKEEEKEDRIS